MWLKRIGAVVVAAGLVVGALAVRNAIDGDDDESSDGSTPTTAPAAPAADSIVCAEELGAVCGSIRAALPDTEVVVEPAYDTLAALAADGDAGALWVTMSPFPGMVDAQRATTGDDPLALTSTPVAATPLGVASPNDGRLTALATACGPAPLWRCIGERAGDPWADVPADAPGDVRPSVGDVGRSPIALLAFSAAVAGYVGSPTYTRADWESDPGFLPWLRSLVNAVPLSVLSGGSPLSTMASRPSALDIAATTDAERAPLSADPARFEVQYPQPAMGVEGVVAGATAPDDEVLAAIGAAFTDNGWERPGATPVAGPSAVTTLGLRQLWEDAAT